MLHTAYYMRCTIVTLLNEGWNIELSKINASILRQY